MADIVIPGLDPGMTMSRPVSGRPLDDLIQT
jgi:hypothetical protein